MHGSEKILANKGQNKTTTLLFLKTIFAGNRKVRVQIGQRPNFKPQIKTVIFNEPL